MRFWIRCVMLGTRPNISFDEEALCSAREFWSMVDRFCNWYLFEEGRFGHWALKGPFGKRRGYPDVL
jgi:hypothetical protein